MADSKLILELLFLHIRSGCSFAVLTVSTNRLFTLHPYRTGFFFYKKRALWLQSGYLLILCQIEPYMFLKCFQILKIVNDNNNPD